MASPPTARESVAKLLPATWQLQSAERFSDGSETSDPVFGPAPVGSLIYQSDGNMIVLITSMDPDHRSSAVSMPAQSDKETKEGAETAPQIFAYAGPWEVESAQLEGNNDDPADECRFRGVVVHGALTAASRPSLVGGKQRRLFTLGDSGKMLVLETEMKEGTSDRLIWVRAPRPGVSPRQEGDDVEEKDVVLPIEHE